MKKVIYNFDGKRLRRHLPQLKTVLKLLVAASLMIWLYQKGQIDFKIILNAHNHPLYFYSGAFCCSIAVIAPIFRWWILIRIQNLPLGVFDAIRLTMVGNFFNLFIPGGSGGDLVRAVYTMRDCPNKKKQSITIAVVDRGAGVHALLLLGVLFFLINPNLINANPAFKLWVAIEIVLLIGGTIIAFLLFSKRLNILLPKSFKIPLESEGGWPEAIKLFREKLKLFFFAYLLSVISVMFNILAIHFAVRAVGGVPLISESFLIAPLIVLANILPFSPGGIGVAEGASAVLYAAVGTSVGASGMLLVRLFIVLHGLLGLPFYLMNKQLRIKN